MTVLRHEIDINGFLIIWLVLNLLSGHEDKLLISKKVIRIYWPYFYVYRGTVVARAGDDEEIVYADIGMCLHSVFWVFFFLLLVYVLVLWYSLDHGHLHFLVHWSSLRSWLPLGSLWQYWILFPWAISFVLSKILVLRRSSFDYFFYLVYFPVSLSMGPRLAPGLV